MTFVLTHKVLVFETLTSAFHTYCIYYSTYDYST